MTLTVNCERVLLYSHSILWRWARLWLELFASTVGRFLSQISYLSSYVFLRRCCSFTSRKLQACLEKFLCFLHWAIWSSLCSWSSMYRFISPLSVVLVPQDLNLTHYAQAVLRVVHAIVRLSSGKTMVSILQVDLIRRSSFIVLFPLGLFSVLPVATCGRFSDRSMRIAI